VLLDAHFNAAGQIIAQQAGNGIAATGVMSRTPGVCNGNGRRKVRSSPCRTSSMNTTRSATRPGSSTTLHAQPFRQPAGRRRTRLQLRLAVSADQRQRLRRRCPGDIPGRPQPSDPNDRRNYLQTYRYDHGGNLTQLRHVRDGACQTRLMRIDAASNRGVRWKEGDPAPDFEQLFDRHGNLMALQPGQTLRWDARDQLASVTLVQRENGADDAEFYHYSQGARVQTP
jgi:insecticidal toxin complex protein TccC